MNAHVLAIEAQLLGRMFGDDLETVMIRHIQRSAHRAINDIAYRCQVLAAFSNGEINTNKRHPDAPFVVVMEQTLDATMDVEDAQGGGVCRERGGAEWFGVRTIENRLREGTDERSVADQATGSRGSGGVMSNVNFPLSGAVNQAFDFWSSFFRATGSQFGLVNLTVGSSADPEVEKDILEDVGTYGRQLGRIGDALRVVIERIEHTDPGKFTPEQKKALVAFTYQVDKIDEIKAKHQ